MIYEHAMINYQQIRKNMVDGQISTNGVIVPEILEAFKNTPRELFVPEKYKDLACSDEDIPLGQGRFILEPAVHARMIQALEPAPDDVVLEIGGGTGYGAAILSPLVSTVVVTENEPKCIAKAQSLWDTLGFCNIAVFEGPLAAGNPEHGPYDSIIIKGAVAEAPKQILEQLADDGKLVCVVKPAGKMMGQATMFKKQKGQMQYSSYPLFDAAIPYLQGFEPKATFRL